MIKADVATSNFRDAAPKQILSQSSGRQLGCRVVEAGRPEEGGGRKGEGAEGRVLRGWAIH